MPTNPRRRRAAKGDVESVVNADPRHTPGRPPAPTDRVAIRLAGWPCTFTVGVTTGRDGPQLTSLTIEPDEGLVLDPDALRAAPLRRLAVSAVRWHDRAGGIIALVNDTDEAEARPDAPARGDRVAAAAQIAERAVARGESVRAAISRELGVRPGTADRLIRAAKDEGLLDPADLPKRPPPRQRDL